MYIRYLYEPHLYHDGSSGSSSISSKHDYASIYFDRYLMKDRIHRSDVCAVGIEVDDRLRSRHELLQQYYDKLQLRVYFIYAGVSYTDSMKRYYRHQDSSSGSSSTGGRSSSSSGSEDAKISVMKIRDNDVSVQLPVINLLNFIRYNISSRIIPDKIYDNDPPPTVIMKMDIEGEEMDIIPSLIDSGVLCDINVFTVEWHNHVDVKDEVVAIMKDQLRAYKKTCERFRYYTLHNNDNK